MTLEYTNRRGTRYFVMQGRTKTGKVKYYCGCKLNAEGVTELPPEFEIHENPATALVSIRKAKPSRIRASEKTVLEALARELADVEDVIVEITEDALVVYISDHSREDVDKIMSVLLGRHHTREQRLTFVRTANYQPMLRFELCDVERRLFTLKRWCFRGQIDGWITLDVKAQPLADLAAKFLPPLGRESFYDLI